MNALQFKNPSITVSSVPRRPQTADCYICPAKVHITMGSTGWTPQSKLALALAAGAGLSLAAYLCRHDVTRWRRQSDILREVGDALLAVIPHTETNLCNQTASSAAKCLTSRLVVGRCSTGLRCCWRQHRLRQFVTTLLNRHSPVEPKFSLLALLPSPLRAATCCLELVKVLVCS